MFESIINLFFQSLFRLQLFFIIEDENVILYPL
jgi:hypothetical protein